MNKTPNYLNLYKDIFTKKQTDEEIIFLIRELKLNKNDKILDMACGYGRHSIELSKIGYKVTGVDMNSIFLADAKNTSKINEVDVKYVHNNLKDYCKPNEYDKIYLLFCYFDYKKDMKILTNIFNSLKYGGLFCLDVPNKDYFEDSAQLHLMENKVENYHYDIKYDNIISTVKNITNYDNVTIEESVHEICKTTYSCKEIIELLEKTGFRIESVHGNFNSSICSNKSGKIILIVKK